MVQHYGDSGTPETWDRYIDALAALPPEIRALGITDYYSVDGYRRVLAAKDDGRLPNIDLLLPIVELRLDSFAGSSELSKLNSHVIFSDQLAADTIQQFFLDRLTVELKLHSGPAWHGCIGNRSGLEELGAAVMAVTPTDKQGGQSALRVGFASAAIGLDTIDELLKQSVFRGKYLTGLGVGEWSQMRWDGAGAAQKRDAIERASLVLTAATTIAHYLERKNQLVQHAVNARLFDASDSHYYSDAAQSNRLGQTLCWIKSDLTFHGLARAIKCFDDRVFIGDRPEKVDRIRHHKTKYIRGLEIHRNESSALTEMWFDVALQFSPDLVAIVGNQGSGKSALTDILALCGDSHTAPRSFLTPAKFCDKQKKASQFTATMSWEDGSTTIRRLDHDSDPSLVERVRYVPQGFFEEATNEKNVSKDGQFYKEIQKAIFSHLKEDDRLGCSTLDQLVELHTTAVREGLNDDRHQLTRINQDIVQLEAECSDENIDRLRQQIAHREGEITALRASAPSPVPEPQAASPISAAIDERRQKEAELNQEVGDLERALSRAKQYRNLLNNTDQNLTNLQANVAVAIARIQRELADFGAPIDASNLLTVSRDRGPLDDAIRANDAYIERASSLLGEDVAGSPASRLSTIRMERAGLEKQLETAASIYQAYRTRLAEHESLLIRLEGANGLDPESLAGLKSRLTDLKSNVAARLQALLQERQAICRRIQTVLAKLAAQYADLTGPVAKHLHSHELLRERYNLSFRVELANQDLEDRLFGMINRTGGTFAGGPQGRERLQRLVREADFGTADGAANFAETLLQNLNHNQRSDPPIATPIASILRKGTDVAALYDLLFGLEFLAPTYELMLNGEPLYKLSPGERGIVLLVFYLVVDRGDEPLIIDQPEGNLNNQSIVDQLVPIFKLAKNRRQVIIVTHNANLAVVCDAEQIIHCVRAADGRPMLVYRSGALENPEFTKVALDVLDGTAPAFKARHSTYDSVVT